MRALASRLVEIDLNTYPAVDMHLLTRRRFLAVIGGGGAAVVAGSGIADLVSRSSPARPLQVGPMLDALKLMNWYPSADGWDRLWTLAPDDEVAGDFRSIAAMGANAVRVIVSTYAFGYPKPHPEMMRKLATLVDLAWQAGLRTQLTLFDFFGDYPDIQGSLAWMHEVTAPFRADTRLCFVELKNEVDPGDAPTMRWAEVMYPALKAVFPSTPTTVSVTADVGMPLLQRWAMITQGFGGMDFFDVHWYGEAHQASSDFLAFKTIFAAAPLFIGETGATSEVVGADGQAGETIQASYLRTAFSACQQNALPRPAPWVWRDFTTAALPDVGRDPSQLHYGLLRLDGTRKMAYEVVRAAFA